jgi:hypothetical protein
MSRRGGDAAQPGPSGGAQPCGADDLSSSYTLVTPAPGCAAVSDQTFKDFYDSLDEFLPTARHQLTRPRSQGWAASQRPSHSPLPWQVPDGLTEHALLRCGFAEPDQRLCVTRLAAPERWACLTPLPCARRVRLVSLAAQQLVADVAVDAHACVPARPSPTPAPPAPDHTAVLCSLPSPASPRSGYPKANQTPGCAPLSLPPSLRCLAHSLSASGGQAGADHRGPDPGPGRKGGARSQAALLRGLLKTQGGVGNVR